MIVVASLGFFIFKFLSCLSGLVVYAFYSKLGCDPLASGKIYSPNQIISYYVADQLSLPGIPGFFISAIVAATFRLDASDLRPLTFK